MVTLAIENKTETSGQIYGIIAISLDFAWSSTAAWGIALTVEVLLLMIGCLAMMSLTFIFAKNPKLLRHGNVLLVSINVVDSLFIVAGCFIRLGILLYRQLMWPQWLNIVLQIVTVYCIHASLDLKICLAIQHFTTIVRNSRYWQHGQGVAICIIVSIILPGGIIFLNLLFLRNFFPMKGAELTCLHGIVGIIIVAGCYI